VAVHEKIERITRELLAVKRLEPARVLEAKRAGTIPSVVEADSLRARGAVAPRHAGNRVARTFT
jgi:hypothetical protein